MEKDEGEKRGKKKKERNLDARDGTEQKNRLKQSESGRKGKKDEERRAKGIYIEKNKGKKKKRKR